jgi:hypothetical protein
LWLNPLKLDVDMLWHSYFNCMLMHSYCGCSVVNYSAMFVQYRFATPVTIMINKLQSISVNLTVESAECKINILNVFRCFF